MLWSGYSPRPYIMAVGTLNEQLQPKGWETRSVQEMGQDGQENFLGQTYNLELIGLENRSTAWKIDLRGFKGNILGCS